ncbi:MAG TPA: ABC transporter substrate-binding protein, partial [Piscinibacter sp.]|nr:ABC transporter substrate-binding protein [Piscinibacter sp.]
MVPPLLAFLACLPVHAAVQVKDDAGTTITLARPAQRIVSLAPHLTELLFAAGAGAQVVGVGAYSDFPAAAKALPRVGDAAMLDLERILALKPDLLVV